MSEEVFRFRQHLLLGQKAGIRKPELRNAALNKRAEQNAVFNETGRIMREIKKGKGVTYWEALTRLSNSIGKAAGVVTILDPVSQLALIVGSGGAEDVIDFRGKKRR